MTSLLCPGAYQILEMAGISLVRQPSFVRQTRLARHLQWPSSAQWQRKNFLYLPTDEGRHRGPARLRDPRFFSIIRY